jgi:hypothetical protein
MPAIDFPNNPQNNQTLVVNNITYRYNSASYRQALRDITEQSGFPYTVLWPAKPQ